MSNTLKSILAAVAVLFLASSASAATLSSLFGSAYPGSSGSSVYDNGSGLSGTIEYAAFTKTAYDANFSASTVAVNPGELAYVYQIINTGADFVSQNAQLGVNTSAVAIGHSTIDPLAVPAETTPSASILTPGVSAAWEFLPSPSPANIPSGGSSSALVFTSTNIPNSTAVQIIVNGGGTAFGMAIVPSDTPIPEPATLSLIACGAGLLLVRRSRR